jgi:hypothetical protein
MVPLTDKWKLKNNAKHDIKRNDVWEIKQVEAPGEQVPAPRELVELSLKEQQEKLFFSLVFGLVHLENHVCLELQTPTSKYEWYNSIHIVIFSYSQQK